MTNKEAIEILTSIKNTPTITWENGADVAFDLAIEALKENLEDPTVQTESLISKCQHNFVSSPIETIKAGTPLSNSDEITKAIERKNREMRIKFNIAFRVACELLAGNVVYGIDAEFLHNYLLENNDVISYITYYNFIMDNLDRFSDIDSIREKAVDRLGF